MRKISRRLLTLLLAVAMVLGSIPVVYGATQEALSVEIITDKEEYAKGEEAKITLKFTNTGTVDITNISGNLTIPESIVLSPECSTTFSLKSLSVGANQEVTLDIVKSDGVLKDNNVQTGDETSVLVYVLMAAAAMSAVAIVVCKKKDIKKVTNICAVVLVLVAAVAMMPAIADAAEKTIKAEKNIKVDGKDEVITAEVKYTIDEVESEEATDNNTEDSKSENNNTDNDSNTNNDNNNNVEDDTDSIQTIDHVTVHDPSIVKDPKTGMYYVFGSHMAWAKSEDLINWTSFTNNINTDYAKLFADAAKWSALGCKQGKTAYDVSGNLWAPDVIWNEEMGKWCMYMSVNGDYWYTSVVLLTADSLEGDWTVVGPVVYSGFTTKDEAALTDFYDVYTGTDFPIRYLESRNSKHTYGMNAIDPCVFYDEDGKLRMVYGSWFGGLYMIELDEATGLRDYAKTYETVTEKSDEYQGIKLAGGNNVSGEAPYIEYIDGNYYLWVTLGGLTANGGYNMRVFRSENVEGPYVDITGNDARYLADSNTGAGNINGKVGVRTMSYYKWDYMDYGYVAQGHNSTFVDDDGKAYVIYHTRFDNQGEGHQVRVHQLFVNEDGWLVAAPFEYTGETLKTVEESQVVGPYSMMLHEGTDYENKECVGCVNVMLNADGTISGDKTGTWKFSETKNAPYVTITLGDNEYKGVFVEQKMEESTDITMTLTVVGCDDELSVWAYRLAGDDEKLAKEAVDAIDMPIGAMSDITLTYNGLNATTITWKSSNTAVMSDDGKLVNKPANDTVVTMTATVTYGTATVEKTFDVKVFADYDTEQDKVIWTYADESIDLSNAAQGTYQYPNPFNPANISGINIDNGVSIKFNMKTTGTSGLFNNILSFNANAAGGLYVMDMAYLGYNGTGGFFDANMRNGKYVKGYQWQPGTNFVGTEAAVEIKILPTGYEYYVNGELVYTQDDVPYYTGDDNTLAYDSTDKVPGVSSMSSYINVLTYLSETATVFNLGWGSWWNGGYQGTISDVELSVLGTPEIDLKGNLYLEEFVTTTPILTEWTYHEHGTVSAEYSDDHGYYLKFVNGSASGNRGIYKEFDSQYQLTENYALEADIMIDSGNDRATEFVIMGTDRNDLDTSGNRVTAETGYIFKMSIPAGSTTATITGTTDTVDIAANTWVHVKFVVNDEGKVLATIGDKTVAVDVNGSGQLGGIFALCARIRYSNGGTFAIDNIAINNATEEELAKFDEYKEVELAYTDLVNYDFTNSNVPNGVTFSANVTATEAGAKLSDGYIDLPSTLFSTLPDDTKKLCVEIRMSKQKTLDDWLINEWTERLFNFTGDNNVADDVIVDGANGFSLSYNGNIGTTKVPYGTGCYMDGALTGTYALGYDTMHDVKVEYDFETNTASLYLDGALVKSGVAADDALTVSDFKNFTYNSIARSYDRFSMWGFMTIESFSVSYGTISE